MDFNIFVFVGLTVFLFGSAAALTGQSLADTWRPLWQTLPSCLLLGAADRFLIYALFEGKLLSVPGYALDFSVLFGICLLSYRFARVRLLTRQYPWIYKRRGFGYESIEEQNK